MESSQKMTRVQWGVCIGCFLAYLCAYLTRLNMSAALPAISGDLNLTPTQSGMLQTVFAVTYAAGQLLNGMIADKVSARMYISLGLSLSAVFNILFSFADSHWQLVALWCLNGAAQSMLWTPIVKQMAAWFTGKLRTRVSFAISMTMVAGHLGAWAATGWYTDRVGWRLAFRVPGIVALCAAVLVYCINRDKAVRSQSDGGHASAPLSLLWKTGLIAMLLACVGNGFVRDGVITWAPTIIRSNSDGALSETAVTLLIPALNMVGVLGGKLLLAKLRGRTRLLVAAMTLGSAAAAGALCVCGVSKIMACACLLGILCALLYGVNPLLTSLFPMEYDSYNRVALVAGMIDCFIYIGSALAGAVTGAICDSMGWVSVFAIWGGVSVAGTLLAYLSNVRSANMKRGN